MKSLPNHRRVVAGGCRHARHHGTAVLARPVVEEVVVSEFHAAGNLNDKTPSLGLGAGYGANAGVTQLAE